MANDVLMGCLPTRGANGDFQTSEDITVIFQSIYVILNTPRGTRPWQPNFGCDLKLNLFELLDNDTLESLANDVSNALNTWEPRISVTSVDVTNAGNQMVNVNVSFTYKNQKYKTIIPSSFNATDTIYNLFG